MKSLNFPGLPRVLIVDDEEDIREGLRSMLQNEGVAVETATTAEDGVRRLGQKGFDVVFLDLNLPGDDGLSILPSLRRGTPPPDVVGFWAAGWPMCVKFLPFMPPILLRINALWLALSHQPASPGVTTIVRPRSGSLGTARRSELNVERLARMRIPT